ncbi:MAG: hypothetical protein WD380_04445 [Gaiellaceae bacterium]
MSFRTFAQHLEIALSSDHRRVEPARALCIVTHADQPIGGYRLRLSFELEWLDLFHVDEIAYQAVCEIAEEHFLCARRLPRRAATFTASPVTRRWPALGSPATTSPVLTPVRTVSRTPQ